MLFMLHSFICFFFVLCWSTNPRESVIQTGKLWQKNTDQEEDEGRKTAFPPVLLPPLQQLH